MLIDVDTITCRYWAPDGTFVSIEEAAATAARPSDGILPAGREIKMLVMCQLPSALLCLLGCESSRVNHGDCTCQ